MPDYLRPHGPPAKAQIAKREMLPQVDRQLLRRKPAFAPAFPHSWQIPERPHSGV